MYVRMPNQKRNKRKNIIKRANARKIVRIKKRLLQISIRVDGYIYRNKPITAEEAEKYVQEISDYHTQSNNDIHVIQVIEKLKRCMRSIIEETTTKAPVSENEPSVDLFSAPYFRNKEDVPSNVITDDSKIRDNVEAVNEDLMSTTIVISDSEDEVKCNNNSGAPFRGCSNLNVSENNNALKSCASKTQYSKVNIIEVASITDLARLDNNTIKTCVSGTNKTNTLNTKHFTSNESYRNIVHKPKEFIKNNCKLIPENMEKKKYKKKITKVVENTQNTLIKNTNTKKIKQKNSSKEKPLPCSQMDFSGTTINPNTPKNIKKSSKKNKNGASKSTEISDLPHITKKRRRATSKNNKTLPSYIKDNISSSSYTAPLFHTTPDKYKHVQIEVINEEVPLPMLKVHNEITNLTNQDSIATQMDALDISNDRVPNDLSWMKRIKHVREINIGEFDKNSDTFNEVFWDNFSLPNDWNEVDFLF